MVSVAAIVVSLFDEYFVVQRLFRLRQCVFIGLVWIVAEDYSVAQVQFVLLLFDKINSPFTFPDFWCCLDPILVILSVGKLIFSLR